MQGRLGGTLTPVKQVSYDRRRASTRLSRPGLLDRPIARGHRGALDTPDPPRRPRRPNALRGVPGESWDRLQRAHQPTQAAVRRRVARTRSRPGATRPAEVHAHRQGTRTRARPDRAHEMGRPPLSNPRRPTPTHPPHRLRRQRRPRPPLRPVRQTSGARRDRAPPRPGGATEAQPDGQQAASTRTAIGGCSIHAVGFAGRA
jgi:hypothetical protein